MSAVLLAGGAGTAFEAVFGVFVVAFLVLVVVTVRWAVRRDRQGRAAWLERQRAAGLQGTPAVPPSSTNGHAPRRRGERGGAPRAPR